MSIINKLPENNTTSSFMLPSEFKENWQELSEVTVDALGDLMENPRVFRETVKKCFETMLGICRDEKEFKQNQVAEILNLSRNIKGKEALSS